MVSEAGWLTKPLMSRVPDIAWFRRQYSSVEQSTYLDGLSRDMPSNALEIEAAVLRNIST
jgi:hypothetical protein